MALLFGLGMSISTTHVPAFEGSCEFCRVFGTKAGCTYEIGMKFCRNELYETNAQKHSWSMELNLV